MGWRNYVHIIFQYHCIGKILKKHMSYFLPLPAPHMTPFSLPIFYFGNCFALAFPQILSADLINNLQMK